ncbi:MAG: SPOR domain-containing protein [Deferribacteres bacterium]|nr:SPOR domain-containing protein [candidate division KSB1 bacterium]MCB9500918.1 SPOR domain-containing protein [Deferribacteres bacterium]
MGSDKKVKSILEVSEGIGKILIWLGLFGIGFMAYKMGKRDVVTSIKNTITECFGRVSGSGPQSIKPPFPPQNGYVILIDFFKNYDEALAMQAKLSNKRINSTIKHHHQEFVVTVGPFPTNAQAENALKTIHHYGLPAKLIHPRKN